ncbi:DUF397 domain-containing protein [Streptomyces sp. AK010]|uniref:DUF397 domain-containing protein n=1 Tax=Streptomyces sp. AK010 TaxID=2723074 RepID=UPI00160B905D|nr:DUF397 domain-containing protein [Streptomyces sp. AK010]MBB6416081.1 hypothetical protein [Streptomyces sp. AK010]
METSRQLWSATWRKSSFSSSGGDCVEVADLGPGVGVRDSKNPEVGILTVSPKAYAAFVTYVSAS